MLDASALIALQASNDRHHEWALALFRNTLEDTWQMNALTLAEAIVHPIRSGKEDLFMRNIESLEVAISDFPASAGPELGRLRAESGLKMPDAIVLHQAITSKAMLATTDSQLATAARKRGIEVLSPAGANP